MNISEPVVKSHTGEEINGLNEFFFKTELVSLNANSRVFQSFLEAESYQSRDALRIMPVPHYGIKI